MVRRRRATRAQPPPETRTGGELTPSATPVSRMSASPAAATASAALVARLVRAGVLAGTLGLSTGCYATRPLLGVPDVGTPVIAALNDRGRVALADSLGPNVNEVEGTTVVRRGDSSVVLSLSRVRYINGEETRWNGERLTFDVGSLRGFQERRFSRARTGALVAITAGAIVAFIVTRQLVSGGGGGDREGGPTVPPQGS